MSEDAHDNCKRLKLSEDYKMSRVSSNTGHLQQVDDYVRGCSRQLKKVKTIYRFHKSLFDRRETAALNVSTKQFITMNCGSQFW